jgi:hypothetical protein
MPRSEFEAVALYRDWVFESRAVEDLFRKEFTNRLEARGYGLGPARFYDLLVRGDGSRAFVSISYHARGLRMEVKAKGLRPRSILEAVLEAGRDAQIAIWRRQGSPDLGASPGEFGHRGDGDRERAGPKSVEGVATAGSLETAR